MAYKVMCFGGQLGLQTISKSFETAAEVLQFIKATRRTAGSTVEAAITAPESHPIFENELIGRASQGRLRPKTRNSSAAMPRKITGNGATLGIVREIQTETPPELRPV